MLEIKLTQDKTEAAQFLQRRQIRTSLNGLMVMIAKENGATVGVGAFSLSGAGAVYAAIEEICCEQGLDQAMGKAMLNAIDLAGIRVVRCERQVLFGLMHRLGFRQAADSALMQLELEGYFSPTQDRCQK